MLPPLYLAPPLGVKPSDLRNDIWCRKTRMLGLSDGERISMIRSAVLTQYMRDRRTDGRTDGIGVAYTHYSIYAVAHKKSQLFETPDPRPPKPPKFAQFWSGQNFHSISRLTLGVSRVNTSYSSSEPNKVS